MIMEFRRHGGVERFGIPRARGGMSILEFPKARGGPDEDATRGRVWIFSGITHLYKCVVPENIHTYPHHRGSLEILRRSEFPERWGVQTKTTLCGGSMDIFWNNTMANLVLQLV